MARPTGRPINRPQASAPTAPVEPLTKADRTSLACAVALALLWTICASQSFLSTIYMFIGGLSLSVCLLAFLGCAWLLRQKRNPKQPNANMSKWSYALIICTVLLIVRARVLAGRLDPRPQRLRPRRHAADDLSAGLRRE
ncbi:hypothetical protein [Bifidobacterium sp. ESL0790]|uniref:hypothetical protein n=1 Tax=Bifidobacterium sp. ESL0790 TaxID=2983233 RepID=UPI0023F9BACB|nr:hypothetical protein [Bifidobacterium sp. ESL0790]WEV73055.1 hypothetical protein OZY47_03675 [Bifidobacterium sp. ESL0790]